MKKEELELIIKRLDQDLGLSKSEIRHWLTHSCFKFTNSTPIDYLKLGMFGIIINKIDSLKENSGLYFSNYKTEY